MTERRLLRLAILVFWTLFWGLSVTDKIIPDVQHLWVGKDFFALFIKFFASLGLKDPLFATAALALVSGLEAVNFGLYLAALISFRRGDAAVTDRWFFRAILASMVLFSLFSIGDHWFGDRFELLEHTLFWFVSLASWIVFTRLKANAPTDPVALPKAQRLIAGIAGGVLVLVTTTAIFRHNTSDFPKRTAAIAAEPVGDHIYKVAFPLSLIHI